MQKTQKSEANFPHINACAIMARQQYKFEPENGDTNTLPVK